MAFWKIYKVKDNQLTFDSKDEIGFVNGEREVYKFLMNLSNVGSVRDNKGYGYTTWWTFSKTTYRALDKYIAMQYKPTEKELGVLRPKKKYAKLKPNKIDIKIGDVYYTEWGYDQTNIDLIIVTKISPTGKTVRAKRSSRENIGYSGQNNIIRPTFKPYGDEFQMKVAEDNNGTYTLTGTYADSRGVSGFRKDYFSKYNGGNLYETDSQYGH